MDNAAGSYRRFLNGEEAAFDDIMNELFDKLVLFSNRYVRDIYAAEDIAIDTFADLIVYRHRYNFKVALKTYLFMIGRSRALNYIKHNKIIKFTPLDEAYNLSADEKSLEDSLLTDGLKQRVNKALLELGEDMRIVVHLVYFEDMSYKEAAAVMKKTSKQIDNLLYRAKAELRSKLKEERELLYEKF